MRRVFSFVRQLLNTGYASQPYDWSPKMVDIQIFKAGQLVLLIVPGEFTTMAGRRIRQVDTFETFLRQIIDSPYIKLLTSSEKPYENS